MPALHVVLQTEGVDGADVVEGLRHLPGDGGHGPAVVQLGGQHPLLHVPGEQGEQRQHEEQEQGKAGVFHGDDRENGENAAGVRRH